MKILRQLQIPAYLSLIGFASACKPTQFVAAQKPSALSSTGIPVSCEQEKGESIQLKAGENLILSFPKNCISEGKSDKKPADIVFVVDITASMEDSLNTVKNGVERFATRLRQEKGWDARFSAIGYRDRVVQIVPFTDEKTLATSTKGWLADGGDDLQEAGQSALEAAVRMIANDASSNPARSNADKIILYIADAISYALNGNHKDFSTAELETVFKSLPEKLKSQLKFYHSTAREIEACYIPTIFGCAKTKLTEDLAARKQITSIIQNIGLQGKGFEFPFTESIMLSEFMDEFTPDRSCRLTSAVARNAQGQEVARTGDSGALKLPRTDAGKALQVEVERCCTNTSSRPASPASGSSTVATIPTPAPAASAPTPVANSACSPSKLMLSLTF